MMFLATSTLIPRNPTINTRDVWIRLCASAPHTRTCRSYRFFCSSSMLLLLLLLLLDIAVRRQSGQSFKYF